MKKSEEVIVGIPSVSEQGSRRTFLARVGGGSERRRRRRYVQH